MDESEYEHVVLWSIFLKYISDSFNEVYEELKKDPEDKYKSLNLFLVPTEARLDSF